MPRVRWLVVFLFFFSFFLLFLSFFNIYFYFYFNFWFQKWDIKPSVQGIIMNKEQPRTQIKLKGKLSQFLPRKYRCSNIRRNHTDTHRMVAYHTCTLWTAAPQNIVLLYVHPDPCNLSVTSLHKYQIHSFHVWIVLFDMASPVFWGLFNVFFGVFLHIVLVTTHCPWFSFP